jgi:hypothetical protein
MGRLCGDYRGFAVDEDLPVLPNFGDVHLQAQISTLNLAVDAD